MERRPVCSLGRPVLHVNIVPLDLSQLVTLCDIKRKTCFVLLFTSQPAQGREKQKCLSRRGVAQEIRKRNDYVPAFCTNSQNMADNMTNIEIFPCCSIQFCPLNCNFLLKVQKPGSKIPFQIKTEVFIICGKYIVQNKLKPTNIVITNYCFFLLPVREQCHDLCCLAQQYNL